MAAVDAHFQFGPIMPRRRVAAQNGTPQNLEDTDRHLWKKAVAAAAGSTIPYPSSTTMAAKLCKREGYKHSGSDGGGLTWPEDIILEVLLRLPAKSLCRFQCVSKSWRAVISNPAFLAALRSRATGPLKAAMFWASGQELQLLDKGGNVLMVFDVGGGTASLAPTRLDRIFVNREKLGAMIIDPASGHNIEIIGTKVSPPPLGILSVATTTDDYSFGRATASGDYKVLHLATSSSFFHHNQWCEVATIMDCGAETTWRQRPWGPFYGASFSDEEKATVNGVLYFLLHNVTKSHGRKHIAAFDLESEEWKPVKIRGPLLGNKNTNDKWRITLTELKGTLCMVHNVQYLADLVGHYADIWLLKYRHRCVWVKEYKIKTPAKRLLLFTKPLDVLNDGSLLLLSEFRNTTNHRQYMYILELYNSSTKAFTDFMEMAPGFNGEMSFYTGSLKP